LDVSFVEDPMGVIPRKTLTTPYWNTSAEAYVTNVEASDSYTFTNSQKVAISDFFDALSRKGLSSKIKKMYLVGFSVNAGRRDVMNPDSTDSWTTAPVAGDMKGGYATFATERMNTSHTFSSLGIDRTSCGAFFAGTSMTREEGAGTQIYVVANHSDGSTNKKLDLVQTAGEIGVRFCQNSHTKSTNEKQEGVFVGSRLAASVSITRIAAGRTAETVTESKPGGTNPDQAFQFWGGSTAGDVSTVGITSGLTAAETKTLGEILYDLCVGVGHTDLTTQDS
jgi:hypothetical protein